LSGVAIGGHPFFTVTVLDPATKSIFQMTFGRQHRSRAHSAASRTDITASSRSTDNDQQKQVKSYVKTRVLWLLKFDVTAA